MMTLLTSQREAEARVAAKDLGEFCRSVQLMVESVCEASGMRFELLVQFECRACGHEVAMSYDGDSTVEEILQELHFRLSELPPVKVLDPGVRFVQHFIVEP